MSSSRTHLPDLIIALASSLLLVLQPAQAAPPPAQPASKWIVNFADQQCLAGRQFISDDRQFTLALRPNPAGGPSHLLISFPRSLGGARAFGEGTIKIGDKRTRASTFIGAPEGDRILYSLTLQPDEYERLLQTGRLSIQSNLGAMSIDFAPLVTIRNALRECTAELLESWGLSRADQARQAAFPQVTNDFRIVYPRNAPKGAIGEVQARVDVDPSGAVSNCAVVRSSGHAALDQAACSAFLRLARMKPAVDTAGRQMRSVYMFTRRWNLPF